MTPADTDKLTRRMAAVELKMLMNANSVGIATVWLRNLKPKFSWTEEVPTWAVAEDGTCVASPSFSDGMKNSQMAFIMAHETLHLAFDIAGVAKELGLTPSLDSSIEEERAEKRRILNVAQDVVINEVLLRDKVGEPPTGSYTLPSGEVVKRDGVFLQTMEKEFGPYKGELETVAIYTWILQSQKSGKGGGGGGKGKPASGSGPLGAGSGSVAPGAGCGVKPVDKKGQGQSGADGAKQGPGQTPRQGVPQGQGKGPLSPLEREQIRATLREAGRGTCLARALTPKPPRVSWRDVLRFAMTQAVTESTVRVMPTYSRASRRLGADPRIALPGKGGTSPRLGVCIDTSGSMDREDVAQIIGECLKLKADFPSSRIFITSHTDGMNYAGWLTGNPTVELQKATSFSGGTDAHEAYAETAKQRVDAFVHFTDGYLQWPPLPVGPKKMLVGAVGNNAKTMKLPNGVKAIQVTRTAE